MNTQKEKSTTRIDSAMEFTSDLTSFLRHKYIRSDNQRIVKQAM